MIQFKDWRLEWDGSPVAMQFDNGSVRLEIVGEMPTGYDWELLVREPEGGMDILALEKQPDGVGVLLKRENLPKWGTYALQLRGTLQADGTTQRHSTVAEVLVPESLSGDTAWPEIPAAFRRLEARLKELAAHPPKPGSEGYWLLWDAEEGAYHDSNLPVGAGGPKGDKGDTGAKGDKGDSFVWRGSWSPTVAYQAQDVVARRGKSYVCNIANTGVDPSTVSDPTLDTSEWQIMADKGNTGERGVRGDKGETGPRGPAGEGAFSIASKNGYVGSEAQFGRDLADVQNAVKYNASQTLTEEQKQQARENVGAPAPYNPNLLDNWYWGNPVNQRGQTSYTGTDFATYAIDRWLCHGSMHLSNGEIEVSREGAPYGYGYFLQKLGCSIEGKTVTASVLTSDGVLRWGTLVATSEEQTVPGTDDGLSALKVSSNSFKFSIGSYDNVYKIIAVGLELGSQQTLAHQENGVWVLNEIPKFGDQLAECQRYYIEGDAIAVYSNDGAWAVPLRIEMRTAPAVKYSNVQSYQVGTAMTVSTYFVSRSALLPGFSAERVDSGDACALVHYSASADL